MDYGCDPRLRFHLAHEFAHEMMHREERRNATSKCARVRVQASQALRPGTGPAATWSPARGSAARADSLFPLWAIQSPHGVALRRPSPRAPNPSNTTLRVPRFTGRSSRAY